MARPKKVGLEYFPLNTRMNDKIDMLEAEHGLEGFAVYIKLLQLIYQTEAGELDMSNEFRWKMLPKTWGFPAENFRKIVDTMLEIGLFSTGEFTARKVLTSESVQKRIDAVTGRRRKDRDRKGISEGFPAENPSYPLENVEKTPDFPADKCTKGNGKGKDTSVSQRETESSPNERAGEPAAGPDFDQVDDLTPAPPLPPVAAAPLLPLADPPPAHLQRDFTAYSPALSLPFKTDGFREAWSKWRAFRYEIGKPYRGDISEQQAMLELSQLAGQDEARALRIIAQSISRQWEGFYPLKSTQSNARNNTNGGNGSIRATNRLRISAQPNFEGDAA
ncbi:DUF4373 domain-containing protein [Hymenobacter sp. 15J16-1T3B]|uniref:DUF4373 domain-containing protein n=1 Tax=Hymenobacter sp. 15J16-1T3B TaxID=2886941 RepID=UPI001D1201DB|nr:DUF4373 domain-containing protein [Hymenobacter sp. 15J16-1T3B]MCC3156457.1 DUF4373 domain-containing protein [Hymenobacter sp. 15J16-1T3B]